MGATGKGNLRSHPRIPTRESARFLFLGQTLACEILNYCPTGFYLSFPEAAVLVPLLPRLSRARVGVEFQDADRGRAFHVDALVAHISRGGLGLFVEHMPGDALAALETGSKRLAAGDAKPLSVGREREVLLLKFVDTVLADFFSQAPGRISEAADRLNSFVEQAQYGRGAETLSANRATLSTTFLDNVRRRLGQIGVGFDYNAASPGGELALIDENDFQDWLNLSGAINEVDLAVTLPLAELERRLAVLLGTHLERRRNPFAPESLLSAFQEVLQPLALGNALKGILYRTFAAQLARDIGSLYELLIDGLPPPPAESPVRQRGSGEEHPAPAPTATTPEPGTTPTPPPETTPGQAPGEAADPTRLAEALLRQLGQSPAAPPPRSDTADYSLDRVLSSLTRPRELSKPAPRAAGIPPAPASAPMGALGVATRIRAGSQPQVAAPAPGAPAAAPTGLRELSALLGLRDDVRSADGQPETASSELIKTWLSQGDNAARLPSERRQSLEMATDLIGRARAVHVDGSEVEALFRRLEPALLRMVLEDDGFLTLPEHPGRRVVNLLDQFSLAADDAGRFFDAKLRRFLQLLVERLRNAPASDTTLFLEAGENLERVLAPLRQVRRGRVARMQESSEGKERILLARARVAAALSERLEGREIAELFRRLLDGGWRQHLILVALRDDGSGTDWNADLALLDTLLALLDVEHRTRPLPRQEIGPLVNLLSNKLGQVNADVFQLDELIDSLDAALRGETEALGGRVRYAAPQTKTDNPPEAGGDSDGLAEPPRIGDWWSLAQEGRRLPLQLIWRSPEGSLFAFANRSATRKFEFTRAELAARKQGDQAAPSANLDVPLLERSEFALFDDTYQGLLRQMLQDPITGLDNRKGFFLELGRIATASVRGGLRHSLALVEFDQFRLIANQCGTQAVEDLSRRLAAALKSSLAPNDRLAAFREDTFALFIHGLDPDQAKDRAEALLGKLGDFRFQHGEFSYRIGLNMGLAEFSPPRVGSTEASRRADSACLAAKALGRNRLQIHEPTNTQLQVQESIMDMAGRIDALMEGNNLYLRYQQVVPVDAASGLLPYYEILLGIRDGAGREVRPAHFIPAVESLNRAHEIDIWVMSSAFAWIRAHKALLDGLSGVAVNISARSLGNARVLAFLNEALEEPDFPTHKLIFEITETAAIESYNAAQEFIRQVSRLGCRFSLDDFGSGYASYAHLKNLRTDSLKIDGSFVKDLEASTSDYAMVKSMNDIGHSLGMRTVAEFVESPAILSMLREMGVDYAQGFAIHRPVPLAELTSPASP